MERARTASLLSRGLNLAVFAIAGQMLIGEARGALLLTATYNFNSFARDARQDPQFPGGRQVLVQGGVQLDVNPGPQTYGNIANAVQGESYAVTEGTARAQAGSIGVKMRGNAFGPNVAGTESILSGRVNARWLEFVTPTVRGRGLGDPVIFNTLMVIDGDLSAFLGAGPTSGFGYAKSSLDLIDRSTNSNLPTFNTSIARLNYDPNNNREDLVLPPEIIRVKHRMSNRASYTFDYEMELDGEAYGVAGSSSTFSADFYSSLKWGGIESVTDDEGNLIAREDWELVSDSGFDYSKPFVVPEPASLGILAAGFCWSVMSRGRMRLRAAT